MLDNPAYMTLLILNGFSFSMYMFVIAAGLTLVFGVLRILNFAHGAFYMVGGYVTHSVVSRLVDVPGNFWIGVLAAALALAGLAWAIERFMLRYLYDREHLHQLLFTFALVLLIGDLIRVVWGTDMLSISYPPALRGATDLGVTFYPMYRLFLCVIGIAAFLALWFVIERTRWGRIMRAATHDREMVAALGINVPLVFSTVFVVGAALAGAGGALAAPALALQPGMDAEVVVLCFIIVIIGGMGSLLGAFVGAIIIGQVNSFGIALVPEFEIALVYLVMLAVLLFRPWGLFGRQAEV